MIKPQNRKLLEELGRNVHGQALREYLNEELKHLDSVSLLPDENFEIIGKSRKEAVGIIRELFNFMEEKKTVENKNNYI